MTGLEVLVSLPTTPAEYMPIVKDTGFYFLRMVAGLIPLFFLAAFFVGLAQEYLPPERVSRLLGGRENGGGQFVAAGIGAVTPFCSCSTVPVLTGLLQAGAPTGVAFTFLLASPLVNELAIPLLAGLFSFEIMVLYVIVTLVTSIIGGLIIGRFELDHLIKEEAITLGDGQATMAADGGTATVEPLQMPSHKERLTVAAHKAWPFFKQMVPYMLLGAGIAALIHGLVPVSFLRATLGPENPFAVPVAALAGAPLYGRLSTVLPVAAALAQNGAQVGTVLAFVVGNVGVSIPNLILLSKVFDRRLLAGYVTLVVSIGVIIGLVFNALPAL